MGSGAGKAKVSPTKCVEPPPADPTSVVPGPPTMAGPTLEPASVEKGPGLASIEAACLEKGPSSVIAVACSAFMEADQKRPRDVVLALIKQAAQVCGGDVVFYSAPGGRGRVKVDVLDDVKSNTQHSFRLVYSSNAGLQAGSNAPPSHEAALNAALKQDAAVVGQLAAATVRTCGITEGVLLVDRLPAFESTAGDSGSTSQDPGSAFALMGVRLWALMIGERMEKLMWRQEALESVQALNTVLETMERVVAHEDPESIIDCARTMIPQQLLQGRVSSDGLALWFFDNERRELVLNNSGELDGIRVPADSTIIGESALRGTEEILCANDVKKCKNYSRVVDEMTGFETESIMCVPLSRPKHAKKRRVSASLSTGVVQDESSGMAVVQFKNRRSDRLPKGQAKKISHFDLVSGEALQRSVLPTVLWLRDCFIQMLALQQQRAQMQVVVSRLQGAQTVKDVVRLVEHDVMEAMDCEACTLFFIDDTRNEIWAPPTASLPKGINIPMGQGLVGHTAMKARESPNPGVEEVVVVNDPTSSPHWKGDVSQEFQTRNIMTAPIRSTDGERRPLGMIQILNKTAQREAAFGQTGTGTWGCSTKINPTGSLSTGLFHPDSPKGSERPDEESPIKNFTDADAKLLDVLCQAIGTHMQRLLLEIMWTKTRIDTAILSGENEETPQIVQEYYSTGQGLRREAGGNPRASSNNFLARSNQSQKTVHRSNTTVHGGSFSAAGARASITAEALAEEDEDYLGDMVHTSSLLSPEVAITTWNIDYFSIDEAAQFGLLLQALRHHDCFSTLPVQRPVLYHFFTEVKASYREVPYHNFQHALSTLHYVFKLVQAADVCKYLTKVDLFAIVIAALCHDCDHRGRNNAFEIMTRGELALRYNDASPLENHHCARAFEIAMSTEGSPSCNIFDTFNIQSYTGVRERMVAGILSTDMKHHGHHVELLQTFQPKYEKTSSQSQFLVELFLHTADISNPLMPDQISLRWTQAIAQEFTEQVQAERQLGLPVTTFMDNLGDPVKVSKSQLGFINFVVHPLVDPLFRLFPSLVEPKDFLRDNKNVHAAIVEKSQALGRQSS